MTFPRYKKSGDSLEELHDGPDLVTFKVTITGTIEVEAASEEDARFQALTNLGEVEFEAEAKEIL